MPQMVYHRVHMFDDVLNVITCMVGITLKNQNFVVYNYKEHNRSVSTLFQFIQKKNYF